MSRAKIRAILGRLLDVLATVSLLVAVALGSLWWRGYDEPEHFWVCYRSGKIDSIKSDRGDVTFARRSTPFPVRSVSFFREAGERVRPRLAAAQCAVQRRLGPFVYGMTPASPPPSAQQLRDAELLLVAARGFDSSPPPEDEREQAAWSERRAQAYRAAREAQRQLNNSRSSLRLVVVPCWALMLPLLALPLTRGWKSYRLARAQSDVAPGAQDVPQAAKPQAAGGGMASVTAHGNVPATAGATSTGQHEALPYTDRRSLAARVAAYRVDRTHHRGPPRRPRPHR